MNENILLISEKKEDYILFNEILESQQFRITHSPLDDNIDRKILNNGFPLIIADYDLIRDKAELFYEIQKGRSKACLIFYGDSFGAEEVNQILQKGVYTIIPRPFLAERIHDAIRSGLENRKAFIEILGMMDELKEVNAKLEKEKNTLRKKNQELGFINLLSREISYDLNWDRILERMIDTGLKETLDYSLFGILYRVGSSWNLALHLTENRDPAYDEDLKSEILSRVSINNKEKLPVKDINLQITSPESKGNGRTIRFEGLEVLPLTLANKSLGSVFYIPVGDNRPDSAGENLMNTLAYILSLSLKNAQEYHKLREASVTDSLTGIYNRKGLYEFLRKEVHRAKRYDKPLSFVMIDMDDFKSINDSMGHQAGDYVLRELAGTIKASVRKPDFVARYGGDEFAILLPEASIGDAEVIMERVSHKIERHIFEWGSGKIKTRMSYGISNTMEMREAYTGEDLVRLADSRLYTAKNS